MTHKQCRNKEYSLTRRSHDYGRNGFADILQIHVRQGDEAAKREGVTLIAQDLAADTNHLWIISSEESHKPLGENNAEKSQDRAIYSRYEAAVPERLADAAEETCAIIETADRLKARTLALNS